MNTDSPIVCTAPSRFRYYNLGKVDEVETDMMEVRWHTFTLFYKLSTEEIKDIKPCPRCFAELVLPY